MPLPIPFYLRDNQTTPLTHTQLDGNLSILNTKIDNTTCNNIGTGVGIFESKITGTNDGTINLYSLSGTNGVTVGVNGNILVIDGSGGTDSDWITSGDNIYNGNTGNVGIGVTSGTPVVSAKLHVNNTTSEPSFLVEDSVNPDATPFIISSGGSVSIGTTDVYFVGAAKTKLQTSNGQSGVPLSGLPISTTALFESDTTNSVGFLSPDNNLSQLYFGTPSDVFGAILRWDYTAKEFVLGTGNDSGKTIFQTANGVEAARIDENGNVGIGTSAPTEKLHVSGGDFLVETSNGKFYTDLDATGGPGVRLSGNSSDLIFLGVSDVGTNGIGIGTRGDTEPSYPGYGKQGDGFLYSSQEQNGLNIISQIGTNKEDYIRFYAGKDADGTIPNIHIQGSGTTKGNVGISTLNPRRRLHISGDTLSEGDIYLPDNQKLQIGDSEDLRIYHDGAASRIAEVGTGNLLISGTEVWISDGTTGKSFLRTYSTEGKVELRWSGETRTTTGEDGLILNKINTENVLNEPVGSLSVRADGTIISGNTVPVGISTTANAFPNTTVKNYDVISYSGSSPGGILYIGDSNQFSVGHRKTLIRVGTTVSVSIESQGTSTINDPTLNVKALPTAVYSVTTCIANGNVWYCSTGTIL